MKLRVHSRMNMPGSDGKISDPKIDTPYSSFGKADVEFRYSGENRRYLAHEHGKRPKDVTPYTGTITMTVDEICELFAFVAKKAPLSKEWRQVARALLAEIEKGVRPSRCP